MGDAVVLAVLALCSAILTGIGTFVLKSFMWATSKHGPIERVVDSHLEFVRASEELGKKLLAACETQEQLHSVHFSECSRTAAHMRFMLTAGHDACRVLEQVAVENHMNADIVRMLQRLREDIETSLKEP